MIEADVLLAFVSNQREGVILETPCKLVESVDGTSKLDIETERKIIEESLRELRNNRDMNETTKSLVMKDLGTKRYAISIDIILFVNVTILFFYCY